MTEETKTTFINAQLNENEAAVLQAGKEYVGIKATSDFLRFLIRKFGNENDLRLDNKTKEMDL